MFDPTFGKTGFALRMMWIRFRDLKLSQRAFSKRFGISYGVIKDAEQGRGMPSRATRVLIEAIALDPKLVEQAARNAERWRYSDETGIP